MERSHVNRSISFFGLLCSGLIITGCGSGTEQNPSGIDCSGVNPTSLVVGAHTIIDAQTACARIPAASSQGAEYLYLALSTQA